MLFPCNVRVREWDAWVPERQRHHFPSATRESWGKFSENSGDSHILPASFLWSLLAMICDSSHLPFLSAHPVLPCMGSLSLIRRGALAHVPARSPSVLAEALSPAGLPGGGALSFSGCQVERWGRSALALPASSRPFPTLWASEMQRR